MTTIKKVTFAVLAVGVGLALAPSIYAQESSSGSAAPKTPGTMDHGGGMMGSGMSGMAGGMGDMMKMMENCTRMMQSMNSPSPTPPTAAPGQRG